MKTVEQWRTILRSKLKGAMAARDKPLVAVLRETLAAIDNAEAPPAREPVHTGGVFAGSVEGLGAGEVPRLALSPDAVGSIVDREIRERRSAASEYRRLGREAEASTLATQAEALAALAAEEA